jgi:hypothetical protein
VAVGEGDVLGDGETVGEGEAVAQYPFPCGFSRFGLAVAAVAATKVRANERTVTTRIRTFTTSLHRSSRALRQV